MKKLIYLPLLLLLTLMSCEEKTNVTNLVLTLCESKITQEELDESLEKIQEQPLASSMRIQVAYDSYRERCFQVDQVLQVLEVLPGRVNKIEVSKYLYGKTMDKDNYDKVIEMQNTESSKAELLAYITGLGYK